MIDDTDFQAALQELTATVNSPALEASLNRCLGLMRETVRPALEAESDWRARHGAEDSLETVTQLCELLKPLREIPHSDTAEQTRKCIAQSAVKCLAGLAHTLDDRQLQAMAENVRRAMPDLDPYDMNVDACMEPIFARCPAWARVPNHAHCVWFSGQADAAASKRSVPEDYIVNATKYLSLNPQGRLTLYTDDVSGTSRVIAELRELATQATTPKSGYNLAQFEQALKSNGFISNADGVAPRGDYLRDWLGQLQRIEVKPWQHIFQERNWGKVSAADKKLLESAIEFKATSLTALRYPASAKDIFLLAAIAIEGGIGFDMDVKHVAPMRQLVDPVGLQCTWASEGSNDPDYHFTDVPAVRAARKGAAVAIKALEKTAAYLRQRPPFNGIYPSPDITSQTAALAERRLYSLQLAEQPLHAIRELYGNGCFDKFPSLFDRLDQLADTRVADTRVIPVPAFVDARPDLATLRRASISNPEDTSRRSTREIAAATASLAGTTPRGPGVRRRS